MAPKYTSFGASNYGVEKQHVGSLVVSRETVCQNGQRFGTMPSVVELNKFGARFLGADQRGQIP
jgi:hypothetical protein